MSRHTLSRSNVERLVDKDIGTYTLGDSLSGPVRYVGRSKDVRLQLYDHVDEYEYFSVEYHPNVTEAYEVEVDKYHDHGGKEELDNERHPRRPHTNVKCHRCDVHD